MHLGRFHATIYDLNQHFENAELSQKIEHAATILDQIGGSPNDELAKKYREQIALIKKSATVTDIDLEKPYAQQIIEELKLRSLMNPDFSVSLDHISQTNSFSAPATAGKLREFAAKLRKRVDRLQAIDESFTFFEVEFERVFDHESEIGLLLPREIVGETLKDLSKEFSTFGLLFRQVNELTGAKDYDPKVRTISSSWWQFFVDLQPEQVSAWIDITKGLVELGAAILGIQKIRDEIAKQKLGDEIAKAVDAEIQTKLEAGIENIVTMLREKHDKLNDEGRINELSNGIKMGLKHMAKRMAEGGQIEIDVAIPEEPKVPEGEPDGELARQIQEKREEIARLRQVRREAIEAVKAANEISHAKIDVKLLGLDQSDEVGQQPPKDVE